MTERADFEAQATAERVGAGMYAEDAASQALGLKIDAMGPGCARIVMTVRADMLNSLKICQGGLITTLADAAFPYACNSRNELTLAAGITVDFVAPAREGDVLSAAANEVSQSGRTGIYDVVVTNQNGETIALLRGRSHRMKDRKTLPTEKDTDADAGNS
jgi:acyl-CoA thioesterase